MGEERKGKEKGKEEGVSKIRDAGVRWERNRMVRRERGV